MNNEIIQGIFYEKELKLSKTKDVLYIIETSIGAKSSFSRPAIVKVVDKLELFMLIFSSKESQLTSCAISSF